MYKLIYISDTVTTDHNHQIPQENYYVSKVVSFKTNKTIKR